MAAFAFVLLEWAIAPVDILRAQYLLKTAISVEYQDIQFLIPEGVPFTLEFDQGCQLRWLNLKPSVWKAFDSDHMNPLIGEWELYFSYESQTSGRKMKIHQEILTITPDVFDINVGPGGFRWLYTVESEFIFTRFRVYHPVASAKKELSQNNIGGIVDDFRAIRVGNTLLGWHPDRSNQSGTCVVGFLKR
ncbi:hypothetical protein [Tuwongella immobilis]|uniref:Uncharacterized protein n=1 Tax=Tuwongella immobilis TaxID=692036 RepID=A0A6C2YTG2_9BACT|nr:hypothetical protein [Tuwongella immobilis]VIP05018.1 unnamed protein product [Tuwongella immobilis]VTS07394.1 unnamed protein product [Tuwongella immobilis]